METLFFRLITEDTSEHQLRPIYDLFESTATSATTKEDLINVIRKVAGATELWNDLWSNRLRKTDFSRPVTVHTNYSAAVCMLANSLAIPISNGSKKNHPDPTCSLPKTTKRTRAEHCASTGSTRDTLKALFDTSNRAEARISKAREEGDGDGSNRAIGKVLDSIKRITAGEKGVPSVSRTVLRDPTIENNLVVTAEHVQQAIRENRPDTYWNTPSPPRIPTPSSDQIRFRQRLDNPIPVQDSMSKLSIGPPPALPLERDLESQLEDVQMVEVVRAVDREVEEREIEAREQEFEDINEQAQKFKSNTAYRHEKSRKKRSKAAEKKKKQGR